MTNRADWMFLPAGDIIESSRLLKKYLTINKEDITNEQIIKGRISGVFKADP